MDRSLQRGRLIDKTVVLHVKGGRDTGSTQLCRPFSRDFDCMADLHQTGHGLIGQDVDEAFGHWSYCTCATKRNSFGRYCGKTWRLRDIPDCKT